MDASMLARALLVTSLATCVGCAVDTAADETAAAPAELAADPVAPAFDARLKQQIASLVGSAYAEHDWDALLGANVPWNGVHVWVPGTGEATGEIAGHGRAMAAVPDGLSMQGPAVTWSSAPTASTPLDAWLGVPCSQSQGGELWAQRNVLSALDVFNTAWPDALAIVARLGPSLRGAWLVGHSAGALPALLAGLIGGAHRIDVYGVPSAVGYLDGDDGIAHLHTDPLDPVGAVGWIRPDGTSAFTLGSSLVVAIEAGGLTHHDYSGWPAPTP